MTPGTFNLDLYRGDSYSWQFKLWHDVLQSLPISLTGATVKAEIRDRSAGARIIAMTTAVTLPNIIQMSVTPAMYANMPLTGVWDLQVTFPDTTVSTMVRGTVTVTPDITDSATITLLKTEEQAPQATVITATSTDSARRRRR